MQLDNLLALRAKYGYNQEDMAILLNLTVQTYSNKEKGKKAFSLCEAKEIAEFFSHKLHENRKVYIEEIFFN
jgi:putative transcriptional regulator